MGPFFFHSTYSISLCANVYILKDGLSFSHEAKATSYKKSPQVNIDFSDLMEVKTFSGHYPSFEANNNEESNKNRAESKADRFKFIATEISP